MVSAIDWDVLVRPNQCLENCTTSISWRLLLLIRSWKHFKSSRRLLFGLQLSRATARLNDSYLKRVKALQDAVAAAQQQIETAQRNAARSPYGLNRKANLFGNAARSNLR